MTTVCETVLTEMVVRLFFFFQAEDGIRDVAVTGVQTCALPICEERGKLAVFLPSKFPEALALAHGIFAQPGHHSVGSPERQAFLDQVVSQGRGQDIICLHRLGNTPGVCLDCLYHSGRYWLSGLPRVRCVLMSF